MKCKQKYYLTISVLFVTLIFLSCGIRKLERKGVYQEMSANKYNQYVQDSTVNIIDVRTESEFEKSQIEGAVNASYFSGNFSEIIDTLNLDTDKTTLIYCETQHRSLFAAKILYKKGFEKIIDLDKGMMHWRKNDFPFVRKDTTSEKK